MAKWLAEQTDEASYNKGHRQDCFAVLPLVKDCQIDIARTAVSLYTALLVCLLNLVPAAQL